MYVKQQPETIQKMFGSIARKYDRTNALMSLNLHSYWNAELAKRASRTQAKSFLDICSGTGEIARLICHYTDPVQRMTLLDFSAPMLEIAKEKNYSKACGVEYVVADAMRLPQEDNSYGAATMAYGIRNIQNPDEAIKEAYRVLENGGKLFVLELTRPRNKLLRFLHSCYLRYILPFLGKWSTQDKNAYQYLCESIHTFTPPAKLLELFQNAGFQEVKATALTFGSAHIIEGKKTFYRADARRISRSKIHKYTARESKF